jgi:parallel beta-helix repeat protein
MIRSLLLFFFALLLFSCSTQSDEQTYDSSNLRRATPEEVEALVEAFILAEDSSTIRIPEGFYELKTQLILDNKTAIRIQGDGMDKTVISFRNLKSGGEGVKIVGKDITIEELSIEDAPGDGIKAQHTDGITFRKINVTWTNGDKSKNGTYAIYPVQCKNVVIDS